jgi:hypothetical protein
MDVPTHATAAVIGDCEGCRRNDGLYDANYDTYRCPKCAACMDTFDLARQQLDTLLAPVLAAWSAHWKERGLPTHERNEVVEFWGYSVRDEQKA